MRIYISNLGGAIKENELKNLFATYGEVKSSDVFTGESRGFGYIEMEDDTAAQKAITSLHNSVVQDLTISVKEVESKRVQQGSYKIGNGVVDVYRFRKS
jgi:RNA recognition motif-containing protein